MSNHDDDDEGGSIHKDEDVLGDLAEGLKQEMMNSSEGHESDEKSSHNEEDHEEKEKEDDEAGEDHEEEDHEDEEEG